MWYIYLYTWLIVVVNVCKKHHTWIVWDIISLLYHFKWAWNKTQWLCYPPQWHGDFLLTTKNTSLFEIPYTTHVYMGISCPPSWIPRNSSTAACEETLEKWTANEPQIHGGLVQMTLFLFNWRWFLGFTWVIFRFQLFIFRGKNKPHPFQRFNDFSFKTNGSSGVFQVQTLSVSWLVNLPFPDVPPQKLGLIKGLPSRKLTYPTLGKGKSSSKCHVWGIC